MKIPVSKKQTDDALSNQKRRTSFQDGQLETTLNSINGSHPDQKLMIEYPSSGAQKSSNPLAITYTDDPDDKTSEGEITENSILYDENYTPKLKNYRLPTLRVCPMKLRERKKKTNKASKTPKKIKKAKKAKEKNKLTTKSCQLDPSVNSHGKSLNLTQQIGTSHETEASSRKESTSKKSSIYEFQKTNSVDGQQYIKAANFFAVKLQERATQLISVEIYKKLLTSYQELLNVKIQNDQEYLKNVKLLIQQNTKLYTETLSCRAKLSSPENSIKIEFGSTQDSSIELIQQSQTVPVVMDYSAQINQQKKPKTRQVKQLFVDKPIKPTKLQQNQPKPHEPIPAQTIQQTSIGHLSSFGSQKEDSSQDNEPKKDQILPENSEYSARKQKQHQENICKDIKKEFNKQNFPHWHRERNNGGRFKKTRDVEPERETIFNRRRRNQKFGNSNSSSSSEKCQDKNIREFEKSTERSPNWKQQFSRSPKNQKAIEHRNWRRQSFFQKDQQLKRKEVRQAKKHERWNSRYQREYTSPSPQRFEWNKKKAKKAQLPKFSPDQKDIDY